MEQLDYVLLPELGIEIMKPPEHFSNPLKIFGEVYRPTKIGAILVLRHGGERKQLRPLHNAQRYMLALRRSQRQGREATESGCFNGLNVESVGETLGEPVRRIVGSRLLMNVDHLVDCGRIDQGIVAGQSDDSLGPELVHHLEEAGEHVVDGAAPHDNPLLLEHLHELRVAVVNGRCNDDSVEGASDTNSIDEPEYEGTSEDRSQNLCWKASRSSPGLKYREWHAARIPALTF